MVNITSYFRYVMTKWKKDTTEFDMSVHVLKNKDGSKSYTCYVPKPIMDMLNYPNRIIFKKKGKKIEIQGE